MSTYAKTIAERFKNDPVGLILHLNREYFELSQEKQANEYQNFRDTLRLWVTNWAETMED